MQRLICFGVIQLLCASDVQAHSERYCSKLGVAPVCVAVSFRGRLLPRDALALCTGDRRFRQVQGSFLLLPSIP